MDWNLSSAQQVREDDGLWVREADADDLIAILAIEQKAHPTPWTQDVFERELGLEMSSMWVATRTKSANHRSGSEVAGFLVFWVVHDEVHILNVAVDPTIRRQGIATAVIEHLVETARHHKASFVTLEVRETNQAAMGLYESLGFDIIGQRVAYYADTGEDAYIMSCLLG
jgi:ribosomal-protein-alanine N-acetyltransferase